MSSELDAQGQPTQKIVEARRKADFITPIPKPKKRKQAAAGIGIPRRPQGLTWRGTAST
ncbi:MAG TPA: hypothetical protein VMV83_14855 [Rectinemataceae bacterium]|nr:hypothetical protein [Rectinemataceae bacterium]